MSLPSGTRLGPYEIVTPIGSGGMGEVFQARHRRLDHMVALKRLHPHLATDASIVERLFDEARFVTRIRHENIVDVFDFVNDGQDTYYVMQFLDGESLGDVLDRGPITERRTRYISAQLASALGAAHRHGIVHRDLKPDNVFLVRHGDDGDFVKLLDFGIAKLIDSSLRINGPRTAAGVVLGTPGYMSPEQLLGDAATPKSDIYSLGVLMFEMVTGRPPFQAEAWGELAVMHTVHPPPRPSRIARGAVSPALESLILDCLEKEARRRPPTMEEVRARLVDDALAPTLSTPPPAPPRRRRGLLRFLMRSALVLVTSSAAAAGAMHLVLRLLGR